MSGFNYSDDPDYDEFGRESGSGLRKQLEEALGEIRSLRKELTDQKRGESVEALLKEKGIDPKVKELVPADADPSEWLSKYGTLFGNTLDAGEKNDPPKAAEPDPALEAEKAAQARMEQDPSATGNTTAQQDPLQQLAALKDEAEMLAFLDTFKGGSGASTGLM